jgi:hypothetical protein
VTTAAGVHAINDNSAKLAARRFVIGLLAAGYTPGAGRRRS